MSEPREFRQYRFRRPRGACELILVRHGESAPARVGVEFPLLDGHSDPELHPDGAKQAQLVCDRLVASGEDFAAVYVTPLRRTRETAQPLLDHLGVDPVVEPDLREVFLGELEGGAFRQRAAEGDPVLQQVWEQQRWDVIPGAEPDEVFSDRIRGAIGGIAERHPDQTVVAFVHGGVIGRVMHLATQCLPFAFIGTDNAAICHLVVHGDRWIVRSWNDTAHLSPRFTTDPEPLL